MEQLMAINLDTKKDIRNLGAFVNKTIVQLEDHNSQIKNLNIEQKNTKEDVSKLKKELEDLKKLFLDGKVNTKTAKDPNQVCKITMYNIPNNNLGEPIDILARWGIRHHFNQRVISAEYYEGTVTFFIKGGYNKYYLSCVLKENLAKMQADKVTVHKL